MASKAQAPAAGLSTQPQPLKVFLHPSLRSLRTRHAIWARRLAPLGVLLTRGQLPEPGTFLAVVDVEVGAASCAGGSSGAGGGGGADSYCRFDAHSAAAAQLLQLLRRGGGTAAAAAGRPAAGSKRRVAAGPDDGAHPQGEAAGGRAVAAAAAGARGSPATPRGGQQHAAAAVAAAPDADSREEAAGVAATREGGSSKTQQAGKVTCSVSRSAATTSSSSLGSSSHSAAAPAADRSAKRHSGSASSRRSLDSAALSSLAAVAATAADRATAATANWERTAAVTCERGGGGSVGFTGSIWRPHVARLVSDRWLVACCEAGAILDPAPYDVLQAPARLAAAVAAAPYLRTPGQLPPGGGVLKTTGPAGKGDGGGGDRGESRPWKRLRWQDTGDDGGWQGSNGAMSAVGVGAFTQPQDLAVAAGGDGLRAAAPTATAAATFHSSGGVTPGAAAGVAARPAPLRPWVPPRLLAATTAAAAAAATWGAVLAPQHTTSTGGGTTRSAGAGGTGEGPAAAEAAALLATTGTGGFCSPAAVVVGHEPVPLAWWEPAAPVAVPTPALAPAVAVAAAAAVGKSAAGDNAGGGGAATGVPEGGCEAAGQGYGWEAAAVPVAGGAWVPLPDHLGGPRASPPGGLQPPRWIPLPQDPGTRAAAAAPAAAAAAAAAGSTAPRAPPLSSLDAGCRLALPRVRVVSYNILGNTACMTSRAGAAMPREHTTLEFRGPRLLRELWGYDADVICLQEVDVSVYRLWLQPWAARHGHTITYLPRGASTPLGPTESAPRMDPCYSPFSAASGGGRGSSSRSRSGSGGRGRGGAASSSSGGAGAGRGSGVPVGELDGIALLVRSPLRLLEVHCEQLAARRPATATAAGGGGGGGGGGDGGGSGNGSSSSSSSSSSTGFWSLLSNRGVGAILALVEVVDGGGAGGCGGGGGGGGSGGADERTAQPQQGGGGGAGGSGSRGGGGGTDAPGRVFAVGTTHLWWDPRLPHVKAAQAALLCEAAADFLRRVAPRWGHSHGQQRGTPQPQDDVPLVLAGDLNSRWAVFDPGPVELGLPRSPPARSRSGDSGGGSGGGGGGEQYGGGGGGGGGGGQRCRRCLVSGVYELLSGGRLEEEHPHHPACPALLQAAAPGDVRLHTSGLRLASAHMVANGREPPATNNSCNFIGCLDYLWLSRGGHWAVAGTLDLPYTYGPDPRGDGLVGAVGAGSRAAGMQQQRQHGAGGRQRRDGSGGGCGAGDPGTDTEDDAAAEEGGALGKVVAAADAAAACGAAVSAAACCPVMPNATFPSDHWAVGAELVLLGGWGGR
ncbi:hypothetical protein CHLRE_10g420512v5 [Chlamydomonas reinhardtii]|uniref:Uncharacterized protein n=1 Tax=Chlamydomonas reinhardtii TaxID=3055 RepID=A0A2K3D955_CHLRE|nr:uncharacterized protein CHLRE_10g420512v5 [Chlamydomonas reinhardtii]PNW77057.1 hypothetical protein CHLRE_10g420512v5 [Chlamydomonas reinhardtii]